MKRLSVIPAPALAGVVRSRTAAEAIADGDYEPDTSRLEAFATKPSGG